MCQFLHCECLLYHCGAAERLFLGGLSCWVRDVRAKLQWCVWVPFFSIRVISWELTFFFDESCTVLYKCTLFMPKRTVEIILNLQLFHLLNREIKSKKISSFIALVFSFLDQNVWQVLGAFPTEQAVVCIEHKQPPEAAKKGRLFWHQYIQVFSNVKSNDKEDTSKWRYSFGLWCWPACRPLWGR